MERRPDPFDDAKPSRTPKSREIEPELHPPTHPLPDALFSPEDRSRSGPPSTQPRTAFLRPLMLGAVIGLALGWPLPTRSGTPGDLLESVLHLVEDQYVTPVNTRELLFNGLDEMLRNLDPNSRFISPQELEEFEADTHGFFVGIGVVIEPSKDGVPPTIRAVIPSSPADRMNVERGDQILLIDDDDVSEAPLANVSKRIKGRPGTMVTLTVRRLSPDGSTRELNLKVRRERVDLPSVQAVRLYASDNGPIGYVRLDQFQSGSTSEVERSFIHLTGEGAQKLILDLRENRGGYLDEAVRICDLFLPEGLILSTKGRTNVDKPELYRASGRTVFPDQPLVILIDGGSASASEIVAAALQDHRRALLLGESSYGKWSVQDVIRLPNRDGIVKLTTKSHHPPEGRWIRRDVHGRRLGLAPNVTVQVDAQTRLALAQSWRESMLATIEKPYDAVPTDRPTFAAETTSEVVDAPLVRALAILSNATDYEKIIAVDPDPLVLGRASPRTDRTSPPGGKTTPTDPSPENPEKVKPDVEQRADGR